jgi:hypothetical protein
MSKVTMTCFSLVVILLTHGASSACPAGGDCPATEMAVNSYGISGRVVLVERGRERRAGRVEVDAFAFRRGKWQPIGNFDRLGGFGWVSEWVGRYKFVVRQEGFKAATLIVNVRGLRPKWNEVVVPLKASGCVPARLKRQGVRIRTDKPNSSSKFRRSKLRGINWLSRRSLATYHPQAKKYSERSKLRGMYPL